MVTTPDATVWGPPLMYHVGDPVTRIQYPERFPRWLRFVPASAKNRLWPVPHNVRTLLEACKPHDSVQGKSAGGPVLLGGPTLRAGTHELASAQADLYDPFRKVTNSSPVRP